ncbi:hypothetical protein QAD02_006407 [Eretmocerus hayati]|uniref:Uncharacterized protein n=1 Tax=Eretmocerus hayati TaxID=131215 RepID=A0ACC2N0R6_9HYME|nr:hypothetical protein QAD02_006407 [Eretmocerus hayati]
MIVKIVLLVYCKIILSSAVVNVHRHVFIPGETYLESVTLYNTSIIYVTCQSPLSFFKDCNLTIENSDSSDKVTKTTCVIPIVKDSQYEVSQSSRIFTSSDKVIVVSGDRDQRDNSRSLIYYVFHPPNCTVTMNKIYIQDKDMSIKKFVEDSLILFGEGTFEMIYEDKVHCNENCSGIFDYSGNLINGPNEFNLRISRTGEMVHRIQPNDMGCEFCIQLASEERLNTSLVLNKNLMDILSSRDNSVKISSSHGILTVCKLESVPSDFLNCSQGDLTSWYKLDMGFRFEDVVIYNLPKNEGMMVVAIRRENHRRSFNHQIILTVFDHRRRKFGNVNVGMLFSRNYLTFIYIYMNVNDSNEYCLSMFEHADFRHEYEYDAMCFPKDYFMDLIGRSY